MNLMPRPKILLAGIALLSLLGGGIGLLASIWDDREATLEDWRLDLGVSAHLMEAHLRGAHSTAHALLLQVEDHFNERGLPRPPTERHRHWLSDMVTAMPDGLAICILDERGAVLVASDGQGATLCKHERGDNTALARAKPGSTVITGILDERLTPDHMLAFTRTLAMSTGQVVGTAEILVSGLHFGELYRTVQAADLNNSYMIARSDGVVVTRYPLPAGGLPRLDPSRPPFSETAKAPAGWFRITSSFDKVERLISYRRLADLDVVVSASMTTSMVFRDWTIRTQRNTSLFAGAMLLLLALAAVTNESLRHEGRLLRDMEQKARELTEALEEKDVLFQEVHHRVKNNLQIISSLLTMQLLHVNDEKARESLTDALDRIASMGLVHQTLYERNVAANVDLGVYFGRLAETLVGSHVGTKGSVTVQVEVEGCLDLERAVPLGMLANEAMANALKHAFPEGRGGTVSITLGRDEHQWHFTVRDDGIGMPDRPNQGIGLSLIKALSRQLGGRSAISNDGGTVVIVTFPA
ncbi:sensor histidine kinase [Paramagnetospirillum marisnigri]|uniref:sensor histidine kinase n=1 Tax=Paramagnetospirillum marisnigri TaxID=1285242 RepID=UPI0008397D86|nr:histidine kinase dimerization/phosphoacceptor domain -containing protein [Paramagnetospirillum marisnigri]